MQTTLLVIDPQVDFCDLQGALFVPGADADMTRLSRMIRRLASELSCIHVTLDTHHLMDIAHPLFWQDAQGQPPEPFTIISATEVHAGRWMPRLPEQATRAQAYVDALAAQGRYPLCLWPPHCLIGSPGHTVFPPLLNALLDWERQGRTVDYVFKGLNPLTEHYSAIQADVPDPNDPGTQVNMRLVTALRQADILLVAGEAGSHCVANTLRDLAALWDRKDLSQIVLLTDAVSPVTGFEALQETLLHDLTARGMRLSTTTEVLP